MREWDAFDLFWSSEQDGVKDYDSYKRAFAAGVAAERERCAKIAETGWDLPEQQYVTDDIAAKIREGHDA